MAESIKVGIFNDCVIFNYYVYNHEDKMSTHIFDIYKIMNSKKFDNVTLYSYTTLFQDNIDYFNKIVKSIIE